MASMENPRCGEHTDRMSLEQGDIAVVGAGVIGLMTSLSLLDTGRSVTLIDPDPPGQGASFGNAGVIANYGVKPLAEPSLLLTGPGLLFKKDGPLAIQPGARRAVLPWLMQFASACLPWHQERLQKALASVIVDADVRWQDVIHRVDASDEWQRKGCLYVFADARSRRQAERDARVRKRWGVACELLSEAELSQLEPSLSGRFKGATFFPDAAALSDPGAITQAIASELLRLGINLHQGKVTEIRPLGGSVEVRCAEGDCARFEQVVLAAGAHSHGLLQSLGISAPLISERGYHLEYEATLSINRPVCSIAHGFYVSPMTGRIRAAGTVELGGVTAPPSNHRWEAIDRTMRAWFQELPAAHGRWMGHRPSTPDSLPLVGSAPISDRVLCAVGHGHVGMTLAPWTADVIAGLANGGATDLALHPFRPHRFNE